VDEALELAYRTDRGRVLACLIGIVKDFDLAEDALQDAFAAAAETWPQRGIPANPAGWLVTTGRRKVVDRLRRAAAAERRHRVWGELSIAWDAGEGTGPIADDRLRLIFTCCHPALSLEARVALTLRSLGGLTTEGWPAPSCFPHRRWPNGSFGPSARSGRPASPTGCHRPTSYPSGWMPCSPSST
jgi:RNA polymerase sigma-70 factor (ECF subfamily)